MSESVLDLESLMTPEMIDKSKEISEKLSPEQKENIRTTISWFLLTDLIKTKIRLEIQSNRKIVEVLSLILSLLTITLEIIQCSLYINTSVVKTKTFASIIITTNKKDTVEILRGINSFFILILIILVILDFHMHKILLVFKQYYDINSNLFTTKLIVPLIIEIIVCIIHTPPFFNNFTITLSSINLIETIKYKIDVVLFIGIFSLFKFYLVLKFFFNYSRWGDDRANKICKESNISHNVLFVLKAELTEHPFSILIVFYCMVLLIFGYCIRLCEIAFVQNIPLEYFQDWTSFWNGFWCIFVTIATIGYGDFTPRTFMGRLICILASFFGIIIFGMLIISLHSKFSMTSVETRAYTEIKTTLLLRQLKKRALNLILSYYRLNRVIDNEEKEIANHELSLIKEKEKIKKKGMKKIAIHLREYKKLRAQIDEITNSTTIDNQIYQISRALNENLEPLVTTSRIEINSILNHINFSNDFSKVIKGYSEILKIMTSHLNKAIEANNKK